ncbi:MAG: hypothetical protein KDA85_13000, partial [Planctomycetaceae bacterium]|nr:hypothetical protein [Planctomycetaceae bacterium]
EDAAASRYYLRSLVTLRPHDPELQFRLGLAEIEDGMADGLNRIRALTNTGAGGFGPGSYGPAHLWLATQAIQPASPVKMSEEELGQHLTLAVSRMPQSIAARVLLANLSIRQQKLRQAEEQLLLVVKDAPDVIFDLVPVQQRLRRDPEIIAPGVEKAEAAFRRQFESDPGSQESRIKLARLLLISGRADDAGLLLEEGVDQNPTDEKLRQAYADYKVGLAGTRLAQGPLNSEVARELLFQALELNPGHPGAVHQLELVSRILPPLADRRIEPAIQFWSDRLQSVSSRADLTSIEAVGAEDSRPENGSPDRETSGAPDSAAQALASQSLVCRQMLAILLASQGEFVRAAEVFQPMAEQSDIAQRAYADLLKKGGQTEQASQLLTSLAESQLHQLADAPDDAERVVQLIATLMQSGRLPEALTALRAQPMLPDSRVPENAQLRSQYGRLCLQLFDQQWSHAVDVSATEPALPPEAIGLLADACQCEGQLLAAVDRLARVAYSQSPDAGKADDLLRQIRVRGTEGAAVLEVIGVRAVLVGRYEEAIRSLTQANNQTRHRSPLIMNNLAIAILRSGETNLDEALKLADEALVLIPDQPEILVTRAEINVARENWNAALADLQVALPFRQDSVLLHRLLEQTYAALGEADMARTHAARLAELTPSTP